jgi:hypothetical protein
VTECKLDTPLMQHVLKDYKEIRVLPDGRILGVHRLMYHWTLHIDIHETGYEDRYCFQTEEWALEALRTWDGTGDPGLMWHRHVNTGRRRDVVTGREWIEW